MKNNLEFKVVSYEDDWDYGLKTLSPESALDIVRLLLLEIIAKNYDGVAYVTELSKDYIEWKAQEEEVDFDIKYETPYHMLESWVDGLGLGFVVLENGNALYVTTEL